MTIKWTDIEAECGDFRDGFVATFNKYAGQPTDEKDGQGRTVKVTAQTFAEHLGISVTTFRRWIKRSEQDDHGGRAASQQKTKEIEQWHVRSAARKNPEAIVQAVSELPEETQREIVRDLHQKQLERAGADFSKAGRKARQASTYEYFEPLRQSLNAMKVVATAEKLAEELRNLPELSEEDHREIDAAVDDVILARTEMHMKHEVQS